MWQPNEACHSGPFQIMPAYDPRGDYFARMWAYMQAMGQAFYDANKKFQDGEYTMLQACAYYYVARVLLLNALFGMPLPPVVNMLGGLTSFGAALVVLETGEAIVMKLPPEPPDCGHDHTPENDNHYSDFGGSPGPGGGGQAEDNRSLWQKGLDWVKGTWNKIMSSPLGVVLGVVAGVATLVVAVYAGMAVAAALVLSAVVALIVRFSAGTFDVLTGGGLGRSLGISEAGMKNWNAIFNTQMFFGATAGLVMAAEGIAAVGGINLSVTLTLQQPTGGWSFNILNNGRRVFKFGYSFWKSHGEWTEGYCTKARWFQYLVQKWHWPGAGRHIRVLSESLSKMIYYRKPWPWWWRLPFGLPPRRDEVNSAN